METNKVIPLNETERIRALQRYEILDTPRDGNFDKLTRMAAKIFNVPIAIISLVDTDRIWFKSQFGVDGVEQINRDPGLCASAILSDEIYLIEDAKNDPRCLTNPLVHGDFGLKFYAASPLTTKDGYNLGTFCILDKRQRYINSEQSMILKELSGIVMDEMEIRLAAREIIREKDREIEALKRKTLTAN
jgi:GAF domain-containing protein